MKWLLVVLVVVVAALHQDFWQWKDKTLVFGFLPIGLAYHIMYSLLAAATMWVLVRFAWPSQLEAEAEAHPAAGGSHLNEVAG